MPFAALFDACVLYPPSVRDQLLSLAVTDLFRARWTDRIHEEWLQAAIRKFPERSEQLRSTRARMDEVVPDACITGYEALIEAVELPDPDDRHVVAAAIEGRVDVIVTTNLKHFPAPVLATHHIEVQHPDTFIAHVLTLSPPVALAAVKAMRARLQKPPYSPVEFLALLAQRALPETVTILRENIDLI